MNFYKFKCINCDSSLKLDSPKSLVCENCNVKYPFIENNIPIFYENNFSEFKGAGLASSLFDSPIIYSLWVKLKRFLAPDDALGISTFTDKKDVLNIGCGSEIDAEHLEYDIEKINNFHGVDISKSFIKSAKKRYSQDKFHFSVASIEKLPYFDSSFDVVMLPFTLHHLPMPLDKIINESMRVTKKYLIVFDHIKAPEGTMLSLIQSLYWKIFDGGAQYLELREWNRLLSGYKIIKEIKTGAIGKHVYKFVIEKE